MQRVITLTVQNASGVLNRITGMLSKRGFNIESITVGASELKGISKMTIVIDIANDKNSEQLTKQLHKQIDVLKVDDITDSKIVSRELALIKVGANNTSRSEIQSIIEPFRARVLDVSRNSLIIEVTGKPDKVDALIELLTPYGVKDLSRTGVTAFRRGQQKNVQDLKTLSV